VALIVALRLLLLFAKVNRDLEAALVSGNAAIPVVFIIIANKIQGILDERTRDDILESSSNLSGFVFHQGERGGGRESGPEVRNEKKKKRRGNLKKMDRGGEEKILNKSGARKKRDFF
jgi:hypothetical protein